MSFSNVAERHTNCFRVGKLESIFGRLLLNFIEI